MSVRQRLTEKAAKAATSAPAKLETTPTLGVGRMRELERLKIETAAKSAKAAANKISIQKRILRSQLLAPVQPRPDPAEHNKISRAMMDEFKAVLFRSLSYMDLDFFGDYFYELDDDPKKPCVVHVFGGSRDAKTESLWHHTFTTAQDAKRFRNWVMNNNTLIKDILEKSVQEKMAKGLAPVKLLSPVDAAEAVKEAEIRQKIEDNFYTVGESIDKQMRLLRFSDIEEKNLNLQLETCLTRRKATQARIVELEEELVWETMVTMFDFGEIPIVYEASDVPPSVPIDSTTVVETASAPSSSSEPSSSDELTSSAASSSPSSSSSSTMESSSSLSPSSV